MKLQRGRLVPIADAVETLLQHAREGCAKKGLVLCVPEFSHWSLSYDDTFGDGRVVLTVKGLRLEPRGDDSIGKDCEHPPARLDSIDIPNRLGYTVSHEEQGGGSAWTKGRQGDE